MAFFSPVGSGAIVSGYQFAITIGLMLAAIIKISRVAVRILARTASRSASSAFSLSLRSLSAWSLFVRAMKNVTLMSLAPLAGSPGA